MFLRESVRGRTLTTNQREKLNPRLSSPTLTNPSQPSSLVQNLANQNAGAKEVKIYVIGGEKTGKTSLVLNYVKSNMASNLPVQGVYVSWKKKVRIQGTEMVVQVFDVESPDIGGEEGSISSDEIRQANGFILIFDVRSRESLELIQRVRNTILRERIPLREKRVPIVLIANFADANQRIISPADIKELAINFECAVFETCANNPNDAATKESFDEIASDIFLVEKAKTEGAPKPTLTASVKQARKTRKVEMRQSKMDTTEIVFAKNAKDPDNPPIQFCNISQLVARLTYEKHPDPSLVLQFLATYRSFAQPMTVLKLLEKRFQSPIPSDIPKDKQENWIKTVQTPIRMRVFNVIWSWLTHHFYDFEGAENAPLLNSLQKFVEDEMATKLNMKTNAQQILKSIEKKSGAPLEENKKKVPKPRITKQIQSGMFNFLDIDPVEIARQLARLDFNSFYSIHPQDLLMGQSQSLRELASRFTQISSYVVTEIVQNEKLKNRALTLKRWIDVAQASFEIRNFGGVVAIMEGLESSSVSRLNRTWKNIPKRCKEQFSQLQSLVSPNLNFGKLRKLIHDSQGPLVPYIPIYLKELRKIDDSYPEYSDSGLINWEKKKFQAEILQEIQDYQRISYHYELVEEIKTFLTKAKGFSNEDNFRLSLLVEPPSAKSKKGKVTEPPKQSQPQQPQQLQQQSLDKAFDQQRSKSALVLRYDGGGVGSGSKTVSEGRAHTVEVDVAKNAYSPEKAYTMGAETGQKAAVYLNANKTLPPMQQGIDLSSTWKESKPMKAQRNRNISLGSIFQSDKELLQQSVREWKQFEPKQLAEILKKVTPNANSNPTQIHEFREKVASSKVVELVLENVVKFYPTTLEWESVVLEFLNATVVGDQQTYKQIWEILMKLGKEKFPTETVLPITNLVGRFKIQPLATTTLQKDLEMIERIERLAKTFKDLEMTEGAHSFELNKQKLECTSELMGIGIERQYHVRRMEAASSGNRICLVYDPKHFSSLKEDLDFLIKEHPNFNWSPVQTFVNEMKLKFERIAKEDEEFLKHTVLEVSADAFESIRLHLSKIHEQLALLGKRLRRVSEMRQQQKALKNLDMSMIGRAVDKELEPAFARDIENSRSLIHVLDIAEVAAQAFLESMHVDWRVTAQLTSNQIAEANKLYQLVMKLRVLQQQLEKEFPELQTDKSSDTSSNPGSEVEWNELEMAPQPPPDLDPF